ncbi:MAG: dephospho-CoA kinase [Pseudobdellovibrionaceae bacterium]
MNAQQNLKSRPRKNKKFLWVGLTGGIATGKSTVSKFLQDLGLAVINADDLAHEALQKGTPSFQKIVDYFGSGILTDDGEIHRKHLAQKIFSKEACKLKLESIVHPYVQNRVQQLQALAIQKGHEIIIYDVPLLFEKNLAGQFDCVVVVSCSEQLQIERMKSRNQWSEEEIELRLKNQMLLKEKEKLANVVIQNEGTLEELKDVVYRFFKNEFQ